MSLIPPGRLVVHCFLRDAEGGKVEPLTLHLSPEAPARAVLAIVLERALAEQRRGRILIVAGPPQVVGLLRLCGFGGIAGGLRR